MATKPTQAVDIDRAKIALVKDGARRFGFASAVTGPSYFGSFPASKHLVTTEGGGAITYASGGATTITVSVGGALSDLRSVGVGAGGGYSGEAGSDQASIVVKREYRTRASLLDAVCALLEQEPGLDELDLADRLGVNLKTAARACDELINQNRIAHA